MLTDQLFPWVSYMYDVKEKRLMSDVNYLLLTNFNFKQLFCPVDEFLGYRARKTCTRCMSYITLWLVFGF
jgi:hypothetical protein